MVATHFSAFLQRPNRCDLESGIKLLTEYEMLHELMELFKSCCEHRRALELLQVCVRVMRVVRERERERERGRERESKHTHNHTHTQPTHTHTHSHTHTQEYGNGSPQHPLHGVSATVEYLRALGAQHTPVILEFSRWVLRSNPEVWWSLLALY